MEPNNTRWTASITMLLSTCMKGKISPVTVTKFGSIFHSNSDVNGKWRKAQTDSVLADVLSKHGNKRYDT